MKQLIFIILLLFTVSISAQDQTANVMSSKNSTSTTLDSNATFTGTAELLRGYNSLSVTVRSDSSGSYKILFGKTSTITTANAIKTYSFTYTGGDTLHTKTVGVDAPYFKVVYTSSADTQHTFLLATMLNKADVLPRTTTGKVDVSDSGAGTSLDNIEADADSTVDMVTSMNTSLDNIEADADSTVDKVTTMDTSLNNIEADADSTVDMVTAIHADVDGLQTSADTSNARLQEIKLDAETLKSNSNTQLGYLHPATISLASSSTVSTEVDTTTITATTWFSFSVFAVDDTLQIALKGDFSDAITVYPFSVGNFINQDPVTFPKAYIRRNTGGAGTVTYQSKVSGY